jgi:transcriptional regulator with XRE-family HTH domain
MTAAPAAPQTFAAWLELQFVEWQRASGRRRTIAEFARELGVTRDAVNKWPAGSRRPRRSVRAQIAAHLGPDVYHKSP